MRSRSRRRYTIGFLEPIVARVPVTVLLQGGYTVRDKARTSGKTYVVARAAHGADAVPSGNVRTATRSRARVPAFGDAVEQPAPENSISIMSFAGDHPDTRDAGINVMFEFAPAGERIRRPASGISSNFSRRISDLMI
jgi:hypothetical protein